MKAMNDCFTDVTNYPSYISTAPELGCKPRKSKSIMSSSLCVCAINRSLLVLAKLRTRANGNRFGLGRCTMCRMIPNRVFQWRAGRHCYMMNKLVSHVISYNGHGLTLWFSASILKRVAVHLDFRPQPVLLFYP